MEVKSLHGAPIRLYSLFIRPKVNAQNNNIRRLLNRQQYTFDFHRLIMDTINLISKWKHN